MAKLYTWPPKPDDSWPHCFTPDTDDGTAQMLAAMKEGCADDEIEVKRTGGGVLCRRKKATDGRPNTNESVHDGAGSVPGSGDDALHGTGDRGVTDGR